MSSSLAPISMASETAAELAGCPAVEALLSACRGYAGELAGAGVELPSVPDEIVAALGERPGAAPLN